MTQGQMRFCLSTNGVASPRALTGSDAGRADSADRSYLPDFGTAQAVIALILISQLVAVFLSLAREPDGSAYFIELARLSVLMLWMTLASACVLTLVRPVLARQGTLRGSLFSIGLVLASIAVLSEAIYWLGQYFATLRQLDSSPLFPQNRWEFLYRNLFLGTLVSAAVLRYFYVTFQWRENVQREAQARITALQARIRPHFLFNSMNTIAALTRSNPAAAEQAVEDLADLFRASLANSGEMITLAQELEIARVYQRMEEQRLGDRLVVDWQLNQLPMQVRVPGLTIQPLLENAIYHGIEPLASGGTIVIKGSVRDAMVLIEVGNPLAPRSLRRKHDGHRIALENIRERLELSYGSRALLEIIEQPDHFQVRVGFPVAG